MEGLGYEGPAFSAVDIPPPTYSIGLLGAATNNRHCIEEARLCMIERRILRLEMLLRRSGTEPETVELPR